MLRIDRRKASGKIGKEELAPGIVSRKNSPAGPAIIALSRARAVTHSRVLAAEWTAVVSMASVGAVGAVERKVGEKGGENRGAKQSTVSGRDVLALRLSR